MTGLLFDFNVQNTISESKEKWNYFKHCFALHLEREREGQRGERERDKEEKERERETETDRERRRRRMKNQSFLEHASLIIYHILKITKSLICSN